MKVTVTRESKNLPTLLSSNFQILEDAKSWEVARLSIQNTSDYDIYIENWTDATVEGSYKLSPWLEWEMEIANLGKLYLITDAESADIRVSTT